LTARRDRTAARFCSANSFYPSLFSSAGPPPAPAADHLPARPCAREHELLLGWGGVARSHLILSTGSFSSSNGAAARKGMSCAQESFLDADIADGDGSVGTANTISQDETDGSAPLPSAPVRGELVDAVRKPSAAASMKGRNMVGHCKIMIVGESALGKSTACDCLLAEVLRLRRRNLGGRWISLQVCDGCRKRLPSQSHSSGWHSSHPSSNPCGE
jgi:hypothetical protein